MRKIIYPLAITVIIIIAGCSATRSLTGWLPGNILEKLEYGLTNNQLRKFMNSVRARPKDPQDVYRSAKFYLGQKQYDKAGEEFRQAIALRPDFLEAHNGLGVTYDFKGMYDKAVEEYSKALKIDPKRTSVLNNLGYSYFLQGKHQLAMKTLRKALTLDKENKKILNNLALVYKELGTSPKVLTGEPKKSPLAERIFSQPVANILPKKLFPNRFYLAPDLVKGQDESWVFAELPFNHEIKPKESAFILVEDAPDISRLVFFTFGEKAQKGQQAPPNRFAERDIFTVEVSNGNGRDRMAYHVGEYLKARRFRVVRLTNADHFGYMDTMILYQKDYAQQAIALDHEIPGDQELRISSSNRKDIHVRLLLGKDLPVQFFLNSPSMRVDK